jgi:hypothetical protein
MHPRSLLDRLYSGAAAIPKVGAGENPFPAPIHQVAISHSLERSSFDSSPSPTCLRPGFRRHVGWEKAGVKGLCMVSCRLDSQTRRSSVNQPGY